MTLDKDDRVMLKETHDSMIEIKTVLLGTNGDDGLCGDFRRYAKRLHNLERNFWILLIVLAGTGLIAGITSDVFGLIR